MLSSFHATYRVPDRVRSQGDGRSQLPHIVRALLSRLENSLAELEDLAVEFGVRHELLEILVVQFVEQLLGILRIEPENLVGSGTGEGLTDLGCRRHDSSLGQPSDFSR